MKNKAYPAPYLSGGFMKSLGFLFLGMYICLLVWALTYDYKRPIGRVTTCECGNK